MSEQGSRLRWILRPALAGISFVTVLLVIEVFLRVQGLAPTILHFGPPSFYQADAQLIYSLRPGGALDTNTAGLRGPELPARARGPRLIALGDSYTYGHQLDYALSYPSQLQQRLNRDRDPAAPVQVINAGVPGYNVDQAYQLFSTRLAELEPDWVILAIEPKDLSGANVLFDLRDGELTSVAAWKNWIFLQLWLRSHAPGWMEKLHLYRFVLGRLSGSDFFRTLPSDDLDVQIDWQIEKIQKLVGQLVSRGRRDGFELLVLNYPDRLALAHGGDYTRSSYFGFDVSILGPRGNEHMSRLQQRLRLTGAHYIDAMQIFLDRGYASDDALYLEGDPHMSAAGNAALAEIVAELLASDPG